MISADVVEGGSWNLEDPEIFAIIADLCEDGLVDILLGGPPCGTWSSARHLLGGPPPVRLRGKHSWGLPSVGGAALRRLKTANVLMLNFLFLLLAVCAAGGAGLLEHPEDRGVEPYASVWCTEVLLKLESDIGARRFLLDQCAAGAAYLKPTCLMSTLRAMPEGPWRCPG